MQKSIEYSVYIWYVFRDSVTNHNNVYLWFNVTPQWRDIFDVVGYIFHATTSQIVHVRNVCMLSFMQNYT